MQGGGSEQGGIRVWTNMGLMLYKNQKVSNPPLLHPNSYNSTLKFKLKFKNMTQIFYFVSESFHCILQYV